MTVVRIMTRLNIGGPAIHAALLSTRLDPARFSTCLVVGRPDATEGDLSQAIESAGARIIHVPQLQRALHPWRDLIALIRIARILWQQRPDVLHTHMAKAGTLGRLAGMLYNAVGPGRRRRAVIIHTFHGHVLEGYFSGWLSRRFLSVERRLARRTDCLIAVSRTIQQQLLESGIGSARQWRVIPVGLDLAPLERLPMPNGAPGIRCGLVGRLVPIKNPALFLEGLHRASRHTARPVEGVVVGDGPLRSELEATSKTLGLDGRVRFTGWQQDLPAVYGGIEVACLTSWNEGTPVALIEAMAAGRVVVATRVGGVGDLLESDAQAGTPIARGAFQLTDRGVLVQPGDPEGLASAMAAMAENAPLRRRLGEAARAYVAERFTPERLLRDITALYEELQPGA